MTKTAEKGALFALIDAAEAAASYAQRILETPNSAPLVEAAVHALDAATRALELARSMGTEESIGDGAAVERLAERLYGTGKS